MAKKIVNFTGLQDFELIAASSGGMALKNQQGFLGGDNPLLEAKHQVGSLPIKPETDYIFFGLGLGYNVKLLEAVCDKATKFVIIERDLRLIFAALSIVDISTLLQSNRLLLIGDIGPGDTAINFANISMYLAMFNPQYLELQSSVILHQEYYKQVKREVISSINASIVGLKSSMELAQADIFNRFDNLANYIKSSLNLEPQKYSEKSSTILVAAGPSLQKNIEVLKKTNLHICAVGTVVKRLLSESIIPDSIVTMDYSIASTKYLEDLKIPEGVKWPVLIVDARSHKRAADIYKGPVIFLPDEKLFQLCKGKKPTPYQIFKPVATVAHQAFCFLQRLGFANIILCGLDLGNPWGVTHVPGISTYEEWFGSLNRFNTYEMLEWEQILRFRSELIKIKDVEDNWMYSDSLMLTYLDAFNKAILSSKARVIDATEGGALKNATEIMSLNTAIQIDNTKITFKNLKQDVIDYKKLLQQIICNLEKIISIVEELINAINNNVGLDIIVHLQKQLLTFDLLIEIAQDLEVHDSLKLKKIDRQIEAETDIKKRKALQVKRDIFYIQIIKRGSIRLLKKLKFNMGEYENNSSNRSE